MMDKMYVDACRRCRETRDVTGRLGRFVFLGAIASPLNPRLFVTPIFSIAGLRKFEVYMLLFS